MTASYARLAYEVLDSSRDDPNAGPHVPAERGSWTWWRTGLHPQGVWIALEWDAAGLELIKANRHEHPIKQDAALGEPGDWGNRSCHACEYLSDGYPGEPNHRTRCDGVCRREACGWHHGRRPNVGTATVHDAKYLQTGDRIVEVLNDGAFRVERDFGDVYQEGST